MSIKPAPLMMKAQAAAASDLSVVTSSHITEMSEERGVGKTNDVQNLQVYFHVVLNFCFAINSNSFLET